MSKKEERPKPNITWYYSGGNSNPNGETHLNYTIGIVGLPEKRVREIRGAIEELLFAMPEAHPTEGRDDD